MRTHTSSSKQHTSTSTATRPPPVGRLIDELQAELGGPGVESTRKGATRSTQYVSQLTVDQRRSVVEASKLVPSPLLTNIPTERDDAALNGLVREYLAHCGYANTVSELDKVAPPSHASLPTDLPALMDKKAVLTFLTKICGRGFFDTNQSILDAQGMVVQICEQLPEDVAAQLWVWWTLHVSRLCPELVDSNHLMHMVLRGNATGNIGAALRLAEQCIHYVHSTREIRSSSSSRGWRRSATTAPSSPIVEPPSPQLLDSLFKGIRPAVQKLYGGGSKRQRGGGGMPTTLQDMWIWHSYEQDATSRRWDAILTD